VPLAEVRGKDMLELQQDPCCVVDPLDGVATTAAAGGAADALSRP